ncbi:acyl-CoA dehydrogenase family protein [Streptomyces flavofungini]|uniref:acyl-CoA dehydrogenase family protein n=1 Tax=Streptomyces flavofungini TaxID=68200 RepID=UPI0025AFF7CE|nr:acyl-CoA dehydrogenase family protein [Streptomyces flavofungini]WJV48034.1 acyl-CoA dehydrogenase family protein [Streptomyces flavofungini]
MDFQLDDDQRALRRGLRDVLEGRFGRDALRAAVAELRIDRKLWRALGDAGFFALCLPEDAGGVGLGLPEAVLAFEEAGRVLLPGPAVATFLAAGEVAGAAEGGVAVTAVEGPFVPWLEEADVVRGSAGGAADVADAVALRSVDPLTPLHRVRERGPDGDEQGAPGPRALLLGAAEQLGSAVRTGELAVQHAREREQFGGPVGRFQAVQHLCADMLVRAELARVAVYAAAVTGDPLEAVGARLLADDAAVRNARDCLQAHGGMGFTWESDVHLHLKRAWVRAELGGGAAKAEEALAAAL